MTGSTLSRKVNCFEGNKVRVETSNKSWYSFKVNARIRKEGRKDLDTFFRWRFKQIANFGLPFFKSISMLLLNSDLDLILIDSPQNHSNARETHVVRSKRSHLTKPYGINSMECATKSFAVRRYYTKYKADLTISVQHLTCSCCERE